MVAQSYPTLTPKMTTWGKINAKQSFNILTQDLDRAIAFAELTKRETQFLQQTREACWAEAVRAGKKRDGFWPEALGCRINLTALAESTGIHRQQWSVAKRGLVAAKILLKDADGILHINKQADEWIFPKTKKPRLSDKLIEFCRSVQPDDPSAAQARFEFTRERINPRSRHQTIVAIGLADFAGLRRNPDSGRVEVPTVPASRLGRSEPAAYRNGREEETFQTNTEAAAQLAAAVRVTTQEALEPGVPTEPRPSAQSSAEPVAPAQPSPQLPAKRITGPALPAFVSKAPPGPGSNSAEAIELERWVTARVGPELGYHARYWCDLHEAGSIRLAFLRKVIGQPRRALPATINLLSKIFCDWLQTGVCEFFVGRSRGGVAAAPKSAPATEYFQGTPGFEAKTWRPPVRSRHSITSGPATRGAL